MNLYCTLADLMARPGGHQSAAEALLLDLARGASRWIDDRTRRHFYTETGTRYFGGGPRHSRTAWIDDSLAIDTVGADSEGDETYDGEAWVQDTDYRTGPPNTWPKTYIQRRREGRYAMPARQLGVTYFKITGTWGYGDGASGDPWSAVAATGTIATADGTALTLSDATGISAGQTIRLGSEQLYLASVDAVAKTAVATRGVNGSAAAAHDAVGIELAAYPALIRLATIQKALDFWHELAREGEAASVWMGSYNYMRMSAAEATARDLRMIGQYIRWV